MNISERLDFDELVWCQLQSAQYPGEEVRHRRVNPHVLAGDDLRDLDVLCVQQQRDVSGLTLANVESLEHLSRQFLNNEQFD
jgi:hypothetical protein